MGSQVVWFRNDLRVRDNEALNLACAEAERGNTTVTCCFAVDSIEGETAFGFERCGPFRRRFLAESLMDLDQSLKSKGSRLVILTGDPVEAIEKLTREVDASDVWVQREFATEEKRLERRVRKRLGKSGIGVHATAANTLIDASALPFAINELPEVFSRFRRAVEKRGLDVTAEIQEPGAIPPPPQTATNTQAGWDLLNDWKEAPPDEPASPRRFAGGEREAWRRLQHYFWDQDQLRVYKETRNGMLGFDDSSKLSPWLAHGCLSARSVYHEVARYEEARVRNESTYWLIFELLWRDYFYFIMAKHGANLFRQSGLRGQQVPWSQNWDLFESWRSGETGFPLVDANMRELKATGFMSNRGRQNVASFLTKNLGVDWRMGAEWFESLLIDYDPASNYGNWNYAAGVGNDARGFRWFNTLKQAKEYDPEGAYVRHWLPCLANTPNAWVHEPWKMHAAEQRRSQCRIGVDYPGPVVDLFKSAQANEQAYLQAIGSSD